MYLFEEVQRFRQWWLWVMLLFSLLTGPLIFVIVEWKSGWAGTDTISWIMMCVFTPLLGAFFYFMKLETRVDTVGVSYRFLPFHRSFRTIGWEEIASAEVRRYSPLAEYGGWGLRHTLKHGKAFNISGDIGLQLVLKNGKKILIGTQKGVEIRAVLRELGKDV